MTIVPGQVLSGLAMTLRPVRAARISGVVLDSQGLPIANADVIATQRFGQRLSLGQTRAGSDGSFVIGGVPPGDYTAARRSQLSRSQRATLRR